MMICPYPFQQKNGPFSFLRNWNLRKPGNKHPRVESLYVKHYKDWVSREHNLNTLVSLLH